MKFLLFVFMAIFAAVAAFDAEADVINGIEILSQKYSVHSAWCYQWEGNPTVQGHDDRSSTDGSPVSFGMMDPLGGAVSISNGIDRFSFHNEAHAMLAGWNPVMSWTSTKDQASWQFKPLGTTLGIDLDISESNDLCLYAGIMISLQDMTDSTTLMSLDTFAARNINPEPTTPPCAFGECVMEIDELFAVSPAHLYEFKISAWSNIYDGDYALQSVTASLISTVPEPSSLWLLCLGLSGFYFRYFRTCTLNAPRKQSQIPSEKLEA